MGRRLVNFLPVAQRTHALAIVNHRGRKHPNEASYRPPTSHLPCTYRCAPKRRLHFDGDGGNFVSQTLDKLCVGSSLFLPFGAKFTAGFLMPRLSMLPPAPGAKCYNFLRNKSSNLFTPLSISHCLPRMWDTIRVLDHYE